MDTNLVSVPHSRPSLARRRDKPQLSCHYCRRRKLRCDRQHPSCSNCASRDLDCTYAGQHEAPGPQNPANVQDRLKHLESLVTSLMSRSGHEPALKGNASTVSGASAGVGSMTALAADLPYVGGDHWAAILESIEDLKDQFQHEEQTDPSIGDTDGAPEDDVRRRRSNQHALLLYGTLQQASREEIIAALPARNLADRYLASYFNRLGLAYYVVHAPSFLRQYESFWKDPSSTPIMWIGLLFSMICLALTASGPANDNHEPDVKFYCEKVVQCLVLGEYTRAEPFTLETLIHYIHIEFSRHADAGGDLWFLLGLTVNVAMRAGYHRDPTNFSSLSDKSTLQNETRRRLWASVLLGDVLISSQMGMPCMISEEQWDTKEPLNLDDDFEDDANAKPRAETEYTHILNIITGRRIAVAVGAISAATNKSGLEYAQVMHLDNVLNTAGNKIPPMFKMKPVAASIVDAPHVIMSRLFIAHLFHKGKLMLHWRYLYASSRDGGAIEDYGHSRRVCVNSSLDILGIQQILHEETQPGGQLETMRWRVSSVMNHQFLIATMVLCSMLRRKVDLSQEDNEKIKIALQKALLIWGQTTSVSLEATRATKAIKTVLTEVADTVTEQIWNTNLRDRGGLPGVLMHEAMDEAHVVREPSVDFLMGNPNFDDWLLLETPEEQISTTRGLYM